MIVKEKIKLSDYAQSVKKLLLSSMSAAIIRKIEPHLSAKESPTLPQYIIILFPKWGHQLPCPIRSQPLRRDASQLKSRWPISRPMIKVERTMIIIKREDTSRIVRTTLTACLFWPKIAKKKSIRTKKPQKGRKVKWVHFYRVRGVP